MSADMPRVTFVVHNKLWDLRPGEPREVRDAYDQLLAEKGELWTGEAE